MNIKYKKYALIGVLSVIAVFLIAFALGLLRMKQIRSVSPEKTQTVLGDEINIDLEKEYKACDKDGYELYIRPSTLYIKVVDKKNGHIYSCNSEKTEEKRAENSECSLMNITYVGENNLFTEWDSQQYVVNNRSYKIHEIENGIRIDMNFNSGESIQFFEYMPQNISEERYKKFFIEGLEKAEESGRISSKDATKYKTTLGSIYVKERATGIYKCSFVSAPPAAVVRQMIEVTKVVGYTREDLIADADQFGNTVTFSEPAIFDIALELTIENGNFVARIPADAVVSENEYYTLQNIQILPNFSKVASADVNDGYLFVPDGAGALMKMNTYSPKIADYIRGFYDNDFYETMYEKPKYTEELRMPVFGLMCLDGTDGRFGFMGVVENGAELGYVEANLAADGIGNGRLFNKIFTSYDVSKYQWVPIFGPYAENTSTYLVLDEQTKTDYIVRYFMYGEDVSYFNMARDYNKYLVSTSDGRLKEDSVYMDGAELYLDVIGTLSLNERILGIPYEDRYSMTTYKQLAQIIKEQSEKNLTISYKGVFDGGMYNRIMRTGKLVGENGSKKDLNELQKVADENNATLYMGTCFSKVYDAGSVYTESIHAVNGRDKSTLEIYGFNDATGKMTKQSNRYTIVDPRYIVDTVQDFTKKSKSTYNYYLEDITNRYLANFGKSYVSPDEANRLVNEAIESLPDESLLALEDPNADKIKYGAVATDVARVSSEYDSFYTTIPFRQLVMNGIIKYTTGNVNNNATTTKLFVMNAVETGALPKFTVSYSSVDVLKESFYSYYYSIGYDAVKNDMEYVYTECKRAAEKIGEMKIKDHKMLSKDVFLTIYENGTEVVTNYSALEYEYKGNIVKARDYMVIGR